jgi:glycerophosphoryl diester phosphodiesterase
MIIAVLAFLNASWAAAPVGGQIKLIANHGVAQLPVKPGAATVGCDASAIEPPVNDHVENTVRSMQTAWELGADMVQIDIQPTADGKIAVFRDATLDCRTNGKGEVRAKTMAELKRLDPGYGYTADAGATFPLRGRAQDAVPSVEEALAALRITPILFKFTNDDPAVADRLIASLAAAGRDPDKIGDGFVGSRAPVERIKSKYPGAWAWTIEDAERCTKDYLPYGWLTIVPESCRNGTLLVPLNKQWLYAGWPNRLLARMKKAGARVVVTGPGRGGEPFTGLTLPEQLGEIPSTFTGYVLVDDIWTVGPALRPDRDIRNRRQEDAADAGLVRRRAQTR